MYNHNHSIQTGNFVPLQWSKLGCHSKASLLVWEEVCLSVVMKPQGLQYTPWVSMTFASVVLSSLRCHSHTMRQPLFDCINIRNPVLCSVHTETIEGVQIEQTSIPFNKTQELACYWTAIVPLYRVCTNSGSWCRVKSLPVLGVRNKFSLFYLLISIATCCVIEG